HVAVENAL
nr:Chain C, Peptide from ATP-dependent RNA helicase DDX3X [Homo sapiens]4O2F_F Chain F, Peptide from ATP-dependent RNA helicase DDX3X [Homo sapiens]